MLAERASMRVFKQSASMTTRDGTRLDADVWRPEAPGSFPVLLQRQAYGRGIACTICNAHPAWYAAQGFIVVVQDIRGRGTSEGRFHVGENEVADGADTVEWAARLEGSNGRVGMYGFSYQGYNQFLAALGDSPSLKAIAPAMFPWDARETWAWENGAFRLGGALGWAIQIAAETARHAGDAQAYAELAAASRAPPLQGEIACRPALMEKHRDLSHYWRWLDTPAADPYWREISPSAHLEKLVSRALPTLVVGGWYDNQSRGTIEAFRALEPVARAQLRLIVGPWGHFPWDRVVGEVDFGANAVSAVDQATVTFFKRWLIDEMDAIGDEPPVQLYDIGACEWRGFARWPGETAEFALDGDGRASIDTLAGRLAPADKTEDGVEYLVHDPWRPAPSAGGGVFGGTPGPVNRAALDARGDVLTFTSAPLEAPLSLAGDVSVALEAFCDRPSFDLHCVLSRVSRDGRVHALAEGYRSVPPGGESSDIVVPMRATCATLRTGEAFRLSIAAAAFPAFPVNPGTGECPTRSKGAQALVTTIGVRRGPNARSRLRLPIANSSAR